MLGGAFIKVPVTVVLVVIAKLRFDPLPNVQSFLVGTVSDTFGYVCAIWIANYAMLRWADMGLSWILLTVLCFFTPWVSWERMMNRSVLESIRWHEIGCNVGRVTGLILGGILFL